MSIVGGTSRQSSGFEALLSWGMFWFVLATLGAVLFFAEGLDALLVAWQLPEYSHGPLIPILSLLLFLRQLKTVPVNPGPVTDRWPGVIVLGLALILGGLGKLSNIDDLVAYALILWVGSMLLISFGWGTGRHFWPPVLHLVYMLPLPGVVYYKLSTFLQFISSELGVMLLQGLNVPVFLDGNIIDLGVFKLQVAEACSGLRYLFPILSFSYIFSVLYKGPMWHKAILLISAAPIVVMMNSVRIAAAGYMVNTYGIEWVEGLTHFFEGWVIFVISIILMFMLAWVLLRFQSEKMSLAEALDLDSDGLGTQMMRLRFIQPSGALILSAVLLLGGAAAWQVMPERGTGVIQRDPFSLFPRSFGAWEQRGPRQLLEPAVIRSLAADDYHQVDLVHTGDGSTVGLFMAWYDDQSKGGVHSPEICLPGSGWEIAWLERTDITQVVGSETPYNINRVIIQKGETRMMVYYWFEQKSRRIAWDFAAKFWLMVDGIRTGRTDGGLVRITTLIKADETDDIAEARLQNMLQELRTPLARFMPQD